ncbi:MAG: uridine monophosphate kinase, partial [Clostridia bacterium]|nr:uridine monophosphate kinase [Clostridia bacterium]
KVVILGGGSGLPFFSTDTAAALRAAEIEADVILMAKSIDAIYSADPKKDPTATRYEELTYKQIVDQNLRALDMTATIICQDNDVRSYAFGLSDPENIYRVVMGERIGTEIHN